MDLRRLYKKAKTGARLQFEVARAKELSKFFFENPRVFYREFNKDVEVWTSWFKALVGERGADEPSAKALKLLKASLNLNNNNNNRRLVTLAILILLTNAPTGGPVQQ